MLDPHDAARQAALLSLARGVEAAEAAASMSRASREDLLDARRRLDVLRRQQAALVARMAAPPTTPGAIVGHRQPWAARKLTQALSDRGIAVVEALDNAADVVGATAALQPRLLVIEDRLPMMRAEEVVDQARALAAGVHVVVQADDDTDPQALTAVGAAAVVSRRAPVADLADVAAALLERPSGTP